MSRETILWSLMTLVKIVLVIARQYQKIPMEDFQQTGQDNQIATFQFSICSQSKSLTAHQCNTGGQTQTEYEGQDLNQVSNCSLQINSTITELFFTVNGRNATLKYTKTSFNLEPLILISDNSKTLLTQERKITPNISTNDDEDDPDISAMYWTLLDFSAINRSIKILSRSCFIQDILLKGDFTFYLQCGTSKDDQVITTSPFKDITEPTTPLTENILEETHWIITVGILAGALALFILACLICLCRRNRSESASLEGLSTTAHYPTKSHRDHKEMWHLSSETQARGMDCQMEDQATERKEKKRHSWNLRPKSWKLKCNKHIYANTEDIRRTENMKDRKTNTTISIESHDSYLPMDNYKRKTTNNHMITDTQLPTNDLIFCY